MFLSAPYFFYKYRYEIAFGTALALIPCVFFLILTFPPSLIMASTLSTAWLTWSTTHAAATISIYLVNLGIFSSLGALIGRIFKKYSPIQRTITNPRDETTTIEEKSTDILKPLRKTPSTETTLTYKTPPLSLDLPFNKPGIKNDNGKEMKKDPEEIEKSTTELNETPESTEQLIEEREQSRQETQHLMQQLQIAVLNLHESVRGFAVAQELRRTHNHPQENRSP